MATVLLVRHGRTTANADGTLAGRTQVELDDTGRAQAEALAGRLRDVPLAAVLTSPLRRCRQTLALALPQIEAVADARLTECGYGDWQGRSLKDLAQEELWPVVQHHPSAVRFPGADGESLAEMAARVVAAVRDIDARITAEHGADAVWLACTHGDAIKAITADAAGMHLDLFQRLVVEPASVTAIRYTPTRPFLVRFNDTGVLRFEQRPSSEATVGGSTGTDNAGRVEA